MKYNDETLKNGIFSDHLQSCVSLCLDAGVQTAMQDMLNTFENATNNNPTASNSAAADAAVANDAVTIDDEVSPLLLQPPPAVNQTQNNAAVPAPHNNNNSMNNRDVGGDARQSELSRASSYHQQSGRGALRAFNTAARLVGRSLGCDLFMTLSAQLGSFYAFKIHNLV